GKMDTADKRVQPLLDAVASLEKASPGFTVAEFGVASATHELSKTIDKDFQKAETLSVPITFVILLLAFGAFVAAGVPVLLAFTAVLGSVGLSALASHVFHASDATQSVILLIGMAVGVDYSLFYLKREREERTAGHEGHEALFRAAATSGQAVLISGITVLIAMAGMLFAGTKIFTSIGIGAMLVVRSEEHTSELQSLRHLVCRLLLEKKKTKTIISIEGDINRIRLENKKQRIASIRYGFFTHDRTAAIVGNEPNHILKETYI